MAWVPEHRPRPLPLVPSPDLPSLQVGRELSSVTSAMSRSEVVDRVTGCHRPQARARVTTRPPLLAVLPLAVLTPPCSPPHHGAAPDNVPGCVADQPAAGGDRGTAPRRRRDGPGALARPAPARSRQKRGAVSRTDDCTWVVPPDRVLWIPASTAHAHRAHGTTDLLTVAEPATTRPLAAASTTVLAVSPLLRRAAGAAGTSNAPPDRRLRAVLLDQLAAATPDKGPADIG